MGQDPWSKAGEVASVRSGRGAGAGWGWGWGAEPGEPGAVVVVVVGQGRGSGRGWPGTCLGVSSGNGPHGSSKYRDRALPSGGSPGHRAVVYLPFIRPSDLFYSLIHLLGFVPAVVIESQTPETASAYRVVSTCKCTYVI